MTDLNNITAETIIAGNNNQIGIVAEFRVNNISANNWGFEDWVGGTIENGGMIDIGTDVDNRFDVTDHDIFNPTSSNIWAVIGDGESAGLSYKSSIGFPYESGSSYSLGSLEIVNSISNSIPDLYRREFEGALGKISVGGLLNVGAADEYQMPHSEYKELFSVQIDDAPWSETSMTIELRSNRSKMDVPFNANSYLGTGSGTTEGGVDVRGQQKPVCIGFPKDVTPKDLGGGLKQFHDGALGQIGELPWWDHAGWETVAFYEEGSARGTLFFSVDAGGTAEDNGSAVVLTPPVAPSSAQFTVSSETSNTLTNTLSGTVIYSIEARITETSLDSVKGFFDYALADSTSDPAIMIERGWKTFQVVIDVASYTGLDTTFDVGLAVFRGNYLGYTNPDEDFTVEVRKAHLAASPQAEETINVYSETSGELSVFQLADGDAAKDQVVPIGVAVYDLNGYLKCHPNEKNVTMDARGMADVQEYIEYDESYYGLKPATNAYGISVISRLLKDRLGIIATIDSNVSSTDETTSDPFTPALTITNTFRGEKVAYYVDSGTFSEFFGAWLSNMNYFPRWDGNTLTVKKREARTQANVVGTITNIEQGSIEKIRRNSKHPKYGVLYDRQFSNTRSGRQIGLGKRVEATNSRIARSSTRAERSIFTPLTEEVDAQAIAYTVGWYENLRGSFTLSAFDQQGQFKEGDIVLLDTDLLWQLPCEIISIGYPDVVGRDTEFVVMF